MMATRLPVDGLIAAATASLRREGPQFGDLWGLRAGPARATVRLREFLVGQAAARR